MNRISIALALLLGACATAETADPEAIDAVMALPGEDVVGESLYLENCAVCHLEDGSGDIGSDLIYHVSKHPDEYIVNLLLVGRGGMPSFDADFSDQDIADVLSYLRLTFGEPG